MQTIRRLVPNFIIEKHKANELRGTIQGAAIFVDLSGFSNMVDALSVHGQRGAEVLAGLMRDVFEPLVNAVYAQGGFVIGYAGDAFNALFPAEQVPGQETKRCLAALVAMQAHTQAHPQVETPFGIFPISIKAGMGYGETRWQMFKSETDRHLTYWIRGASLNRAILAEAHAHAGDIFADPVSFEYIKKNVEAEPTKGAFQITKILAPLPVPTGITEPDPDLTPMNSFFPESLLRQPTVGEFRHIINVFVDIPVNISDEAMVTPFMQTVYALQEKYGGFFLRPELGDKGFNLLIFWGAPVARERDVERALSFVIDLATRTKLTLRAGISYRTAYAGFMGASLREDYTAYGWGITFASRLMTYAKQGEIWVDEEIARRAKEAFDLKYLGNYSYKGLTKKQRTYRLLGKKSEKQAIYHGELIGRKAEMDMLASFMAPIRAGHFAGLMLVRGEAGIGKSRLIYAFQNSEYFKDFPVQWLRLPAEELVRNAFNPFKPWLRRRFGVTENETDAANWESFSSALEMLVASLPDPKLASELRRTASVLAALLNLTQPDTFYESLDIKARYENTFIALSTLFRAESLHNPIVLLLEDAHWLDEDSVAFINYFIRSLLADDKDYPIALIATQRPEGNTSLSEEAPAQNITLGKLSSVGLHALAEDTLGKPIAENLGTLLEARAEGNPFFAEQILRYLSEEKLLTIDKDGKYSTDKKALSSLPMDVRAIMIARLDRLTQQVRETVQTASVLGREFIVDVLVEMLRSQLEKLPGYVQEAEQAKIWAHLNEIEYIFSHALLRDAAYSMQLAVRQQALHALAFAALKEVHQENLKPYYGELAYHAEKGNLTEEAIHYLTLAGDLAKDAYQNRQAIDYFTRTLALLPKDKKEERFELLIKRVEAFYNLGDSNSQVDDLAEMDKLAHELNDDILQARSLIRAAYRFTVMGDAPQTVEHMSKAKKLIQNTNADKILMTVYMILPDALMRQGKLTEARIAAEEGLAHAQRIHDQTGEAYTSLTLGLIALEQDSPTTAKKHQEKALSIARKLKDHYLEGKALNNLALAVGMTQGDYYAAYQYFKQALAVFQEQGNQTGKGLVLANLGWISSILGDYPNAMSYYESSLKINRELGNNLQERFTYINLSASSIGQGLKSEALEWANKALQHALDAQDRMAEHWSYFYIGHAQLLNNEFEAAKEAFLECMKIRKEVAGADILITEARAGLAQAYISFQESDMASQEAEAIYQHMETNPAFEGAEEPLRIYLSLHNAFAKNKDPRTQQVLKNASQLLEQQVKKLNSTEAQRIFVENVPWRKTIKEKAEN